MITADLFYRFGIALIIGMLVGLERERAGGHSQRELLAGIRTFALFGVSGCLAAFTADILDSPWPFIAIVGVLGLLITVAHAVAAWRDEIGLTTEVSALVTILAGALCYWDYVALAAAVAVATTLLLSMKLEMHRFARQVTQEDIYATLKFAVITTIILPVLPNQSIGPAPLDVVNPYRIWLMVVFISGISFCGYVLMKLVDAHRGIGLTGLLGGMVSSTAVTMSFAERSQKQAALGKTFALAILLAWSVMFVRVLIEVAVVNRVLLLTVWPPLSGAAVVTLGYVGFLYFTQTSTSTDGVNVANPFELGSAIKFGLLYGAILLISRAAELYLGNMGLLLSSAIAGIADVDAITLSVAQLSSQPGGLEVTTATHAIVLATVSNTLVKSGIVVMSGSALLRRSLLPGVLLIVVVSVVLGLVV